MSLSSLKKKQQPLPVTQQVRDTILDVENVYDPVGAQYIPSDLEKIITLAESKDPIGDDIHSPVKGLVHRHKDRVLFKITNRCAIYCRFCFRKEMVGHDKETVTEKELEVAIDYIKEHNGIREVILSGGDPLTLSNKNLQILIQKLETIEHIDIIRIHTRTPIVQPKRIDDDFLKIFETCNKAIYIVLHVNHVQEINQTIKEMFKKLTRSKATILSQSVLLKNINDTTEALEDLFRTLVAHNIKPYYLHHLDLAPGTGHFRVPIQIGQKLMQDLRKRLSGLCMPSYVLDIPNGYGKVPINENSAHLQEDGKYLIKDHDGVYHVYDDTGLQK